MATPLNNSLLKGIEILSLFSPARSEISAATAVEHLGMNAATAHRFLTTLQHCGAVRAVRRGHFALGPRIEELAQLVDDGGASLADRVQPEVDGLCDALGESAMACRPMPAGPTCLCAAEPARPLTVSVEAGAVLSLQQSSQGRLLLADMSPEERAETFAQMPASEGVPERELDSIARRGYAVTLGTSEPDIGAVAVPVRDRTGQIRLTLSVFGLLSRFDQELIKQARTEMFAAAERLGAAI